MPASPLPRTTGRSGRRAGEGARRIFDDTNEKLGLLQKQVQKDEEMKALEAQMATEKSASETAERVGDAELALKTADTVNAPKYAPEIYKEAQEILAEAEERDAGRPDATGPDQRHHRARRQPRTRPRRPSRAMLAIRRRKKTASGPMRFMPRPAAVPGVTVPSRHSRLARTHDEFPSRLKRCSPEADRRSPGQGRVLDP